MLVRLSDLVLCAGFRPNPVQYLGKTPADHLPNALIENNLDVQTITSTGRGAKTYFYTSGGAGLAEQFIEMASLPTIPFQTASFSAFVTG